MPYSASELRDLKEMIEGMSHHHQIEVLRILHDKNNGSLNENQNGTFINITELNDNIKKELLKYINYVDVQRKLLDKDEVKKNELEEAFFNNSQ